jgi:exodeoxyribonuclease VII small subunit
LILGRKKESSSENTSFEESAKQLSEIVSKLEDDKIEIDEAVDLFAQGIDALAVCKEKLAETYGKITELKKGKNGKLVEEILDLK